jgi:tripartite-type tricarboxylate transporter receptor subunit TctC
MLVPAKTPSDIVKRLNVEVMKALNSPDVKAKLAVQGAEPLGSTPEEYGQYIQTEIARWGQVVKLTGATLD